MKKAALMLIILDCLAELSFGQNGKIGLGIILGEPTGLSAKYWTSTTTAFDAGAAWSLVNGGTFLQIARRLPLHNFHIFKMDKGKTALYYGFGGRVKFADQTIVASASRSVSPTSSRTDRSFPRIVPMLTSSATEVGIGGGAGFRYYF